MMLWSVENSDTSIPPAEFQQLLRTIFTHIDGQARDCLVLDGLDNEGWTRSILVDEIIRSHLTRRGSNPLKCAISSRDLYCAKPHREISVEVNLRDEFGVQADLLAYATQKVTDLGKRSSKDEWKKVLLAKQLCSRANGSFLWMSLAIEDIHRDQRIQELDISEKIQSLPFTIDGIYQKSLEHIHPQDIAVVQSIFCWLIVARRPLNPFELTQAISVLTDSHQLSESLKLTPSEAEYPAIGQRLSRICGLLVLVTEQNIVQFRHRSVKEFSFLTAGRHGRGILLWNLTNLSHEHA